VSTDIRSGITDDPNRSNDSEYIGELITVSLERMEVVNGLPRLPK
jgi:predicted helicase